MEAPHFLDHLRKVVSEKEDDVFSTWYDCNGTVTEEYSFNKLWTKAGVIAHHLRKEWGLNKGDHAILCYNFGLHFFASLLGCFRAGIVAVLVYPPGPPLARSLKKMTGICADCSPKLILTDSKVNILRKGDKLNPLSKSKGLWPDEVQWKVTDMLDTSLPMSITRRIKAGSCQSWLSGTDAVFDDPSIEANDLAFLQYTSGSTGDPKGVMITFSSLKANVELVRNGFLKCYEDDGCIPSKIQGFSWLSQYHDLGLIYAAITPFSCGWRMHMMSPITFLKNPLLWLELMSKHGVSWTVAPDFAIHYVSRKFKEASERSGGGNPIAELDLSSIRYISVGAEPVRLTTPSALDMLHKYGLRKDWFHTGYGLAENVVGVCWVHGIVTPQAPSKGSFIACGHRRNFDESLQVKIVSESTYDELPDGQQGEIWLGGPSKAAGYFGNPDLTKEVFRATLRGDTRTFLRTGDIGFFENNYLYICGRIKDLIIFNGVNHYPQDIEFTAQELSKAVRPGCVAAFSHNESQHDGVIEIVFEIRKETDEAITACRNICIGVSGALGLPISRVVAIREKTIPKTTSGKIRRRATRSALHAGHLNILSEWNQGSEYINMNAATILPEQSSPKTVQLHERKKEILLKEACAILSELKGGIKVNATDDFSSIALSSMELMQFRDKVCESVGVKSETFPVDMLFSPNNETQTVQDIIHSWFLSTINAELSGNEQYVPTSLDGVDEADREHHPQLGKCNWLLQMMALIIPSFYLAVSIYPPLALFLFLLETFGRLWTFICLPIITITYCTASGAALIAFKWIILGQLHSNDSLKVWTWKFACRWVTRQCMRHCWMFTPWAAMGSTAPLTWLYRCLGCQIGRGSTLGLGSIDDPDLVIVGDDTSVNGTILTSWVHKGFQLFETVHIGSETSIQGFTFISPGARIGSKVVLHMGSSVGPRTNLPDKTEWRGKPAGKVANAIDRRTSTGASGGGWYGFFIAWQVVVKLIIVPYFVSLPVIGLSRLGDLVELPAMLHMLPLWVTLMKISMYLSAILIKWLLVGSLKPGSWPLHGFFHHRKYLVDSLFEAIELLDSAWIFFSFERLSIIYNLLLHANGTIIDWLSAIRINGLFTSYGLVQFGGKDIHIGGASQLSVFDVHDKMLCAGNVIVEDQVMVGTSAVLCSGAHLVSGSAVGQYSIANDKVDQGQTVLGSRKTFMLTNFGDKPDTVNHIHKHLVQVMMVCFCLAFFSICIQIIMISWAAVGPPRDFAPSSAIDVAMIALVLSGTITMLVPILGMIFSLFCRYTILPFGHTEGFHSLGSARWYQFAMHALVITIARDQILMFVGGTSLEKLWHSLLGARFGRDTYLDGVKIFEPDLVTVGKACVLDYRINTGSLSPHDVARDGVHIRALKIGDSVTVSSGCQIRGGDTIGDNVTILPFSAALTGSTMRSGTYFGYPCKRVHNNYATLRSLPAKFD